MLSEVQRKILNYITEFIKNKGYSPSIREITSAIGFKSSGAVKRHLEKLDELGYIEKDPFKNRAITLVTSKGKESMEKKQIPILTNGIQNSNEIINVPIISKYKHNKDLLDKDNIDGYLPIPKFYVGDETCFLYRMVGESMVNAGIMEDDFVLIKLQDHVENMDKVLVLLGENISVKTYIKEKDFIKLKPENDYMSEILVKKCTVLGKVIGSFRVY